MPNKHGSGALTPGEGTPAEEDFPSVPPTELYQHYDIRLVMRELGTLGGKLDAIAGRAEKQDAKLDAIRDKVQDVKDEIGSKIHEVEKTVHGFRTGAIVAGSIITVAAFGFWYLEGDRITSLLKQPAQQPAIATPQSPKAP